MRLPSVPKLSLLLVVLTAFRIAASTTSPFGSLDGAVSGSNGSKTVSQYAVLHVYGWACDQEDGAPVAKVQVFVDGSLIGNATLGSQRNDVAAGWGSQCLNSGWTLDYNIGNLMVGSHTVTAVAYDSMGANATSGPSTSGAGIFRVMNNAPFGSLDDASDRNGNKTLSQNTVLHVYGWAADPSEGAPVSQVQVFVDGSLIGNAILGSQRNDVAAGWGSVYLNSGWSLDHNIGSLAAGSHTVTVMAYDSHGASSQLGPSSSGAETFTVGNSGLGAIDHVIFMMQENQTFDAYFGMLNPYRKANGYAVGDDGKEYDVDGTDDKLGTTNTNDQNTVFQLFKLQTSCTNDMSSAWLESYGDVSRYDFSTTRSMLMDGFVHTAEGDGGYPDAGKRAMGYFDQGFLNYYYYMASQFAISDRWFSPVASKTVPNRVATMSGGTTQGLVHDPSNDDHLPELNIETIFQELDQAGVSWKIYYKNTDIGDPFPATTFGYFAYSGNFMYGPPCSAPTTDVNGACIDTNHIAPLSQFTTDAQNGTLPQFAYIEPGYNDCTDEHPQCDVTVGQAVVANLVNTLMNSQSWKDSVFFLSFDEGGGPYEHVPPVPNHTNQNTDSSLGITTDISSIAVNPDQYFPCRAPIDSSGNQMPSLHCDLLSYGSYADPGYNSGDAAAQQGFAAQLGFRVPNIVISPFSRRHYVSHIPMDHTAIIKFVENRFIGASAHLTARDAAQPNLLDFFDFNAVPWATPPSPPTPAGGSCNPGNI